MNTTNSRSKMAREWTHTSLTQESSWITVEPTMNIGPFALQGMSLQIKVITAKELPWTSQLQMWFSSGQPKLFLKLSYATLSPQFYPINPSNAQFP